MQFITVLRKGALFWFSLLKNEGGKAKKMLQVEVCAKNGLCHWAMCWSASLEGLWQQELQHTRTGAGSAAHWHVSEAQQHPGLYQPCVLLSLPGPKYGCRNAHGIVHLPINRFGRAASALATAEDDREGTLATKWDPQWGGRREEKLQSHWSCGPLCISPASLRTLHSQCWSSAETGPQRGLPLFSAGRRRKCLIRGRWESHRILCDAQGTCRDPQGRQEQHPQYCRFSITHLQQMGEISAAVGCYFPRPWVWRPERVFHPKRDEYLVLGGVTQEQKPICSLSSPSLCLAPNKVRERLRNPFLKGSTPATC